MKGISDKMAEAVVRGAGKEEECIEVISYGLQAVLGVIAKFLAIMFTGALLGLFKEMLVVSCTFVAMRMVAGGVHFSTYYRCFVSGLILFTAGGYISGYFQNSPPGLGLAYLLAGGCFAAYSLWRYSPRDNPNRLIEKEELPRFRKISLLLGGSVLLISAVTYSIRGEAQWYHYSLVTGLALEGFFLTDLGYKLIYTIESMLEKGGGATDGEV